MQHRRWERRSGATIAGGADQGCGSVGCRGEDRSMLPTVPARVTVGVRCCYEEDPRSSSTQVAIDALAVLGPTSDALKKLKDDVKPFVLMVGSKYLRTVGGRETFTNFSVLPESRHILEQNAVSDRVAASEVFLHFETTASNLEGVEMKIGSEKLAGEGAQKTFVWTGVPEDVQVTTQKWRRSLFFPSRSMGRVSVSREGASIGRRQRNG